jgi:hypothetical protein
MCRVKTDPAPKPSDTEAIMRKTMRRAFVLCGLAAVAILAARPGLSQDTTKLEHTDAEKQAMQKVEALGGHVMELAQNDKHLEVTYHLTDGDVTDEDLAPLANMPLLVHVNLRGTKVTDAGLKNLAGCKSLRKLHLEKTSITDAGLEHLKGLENLEYLNLYGTNVTDAGLKHLEPLKKLRKLYLWETKVTDAGVENLKKALPEVTVIRGLSLAEPMPEKEAEAAGAKKEEKKEEKK